MTDSCLFCKLQNAKSSIVHENDLFYVIVDRYPVSDRHLLVITKSHKEFFHECDDELLSNWLVTAKHIVQKMGMKAYNLVQNNINGQAIRHCHIHVIEANESGSLDLGSKSLQLNDEEYANLVKKIKVQLEN